MSLPRYPEYKDSGMTWLGEVPSHWTPSRFKWLIGRNDGGVWGDDPDGTDDTLVLRSTEQTVDGHWRIEEPAFRKLAARERDSALLGVGDLLITKSSGSALHIGKTTLVDEHIAGLGACYSNFMQRVRVSKRLHPKLAWYLLNSDLSRAQLAYLSNSTTGLANLNGTILGELLLAVQPQDEQAYIVAFLDHETAKIDALIAEQEKLLALLAEKRQATISHAVTRGLDPNARMKASAIPWLGEVPAHWQIANIKRLCELITDGAHVSPETEDGAFCFVSTKDVGRDGIDFEGCLLTSAASYEYLDRTGCQPLVGDVLFSKDGTVGRTTVVRDKKEFVVASSLIIIRPMGGRLDPNFLDYLCQSRLVKNQVEGFVKGAGLPRLSIQNLLKVVGVFPPLSEQRRISGFVAECLERSDRLENEVLHAVSTLKERRSALIAAAVTGQIDVRDVVEAQAA
jgi:type I restriction enzyme, S subunit